MLKEKPEEAERLADEIIRNTYRTLMTRGQKGCFIYCTDKGLEDYYKNRISEIQISFEENEFFKSRLSVAEEFEEYKG
jgi:uncharacterized protein